MGSVVIPFPQRFRGTVGKRRAARYLGRSTRWVELMMRDHGLPYARDARGWAQFDLEALDAWRTEYERKLAERRRRAVGGLARE